MVQESFTPWLAISVTARSYCHLVAAGAKDSPFHHYRIMALIWPWGQGLNKVLYQNFYILCLHPTLCWDFSLVVRRLFFKVVWFSHYLYYNWHPVYTNATMVWIILSDRLCFVKHSTCMITLSLEENNDGMNCSWWLLIVFPPVES